MIVQLGVVGAHLRGQPLNHQLLDLGAVFSRPALTVPIYRLFALANTSPPKPGMIRSSVGASIEVEIWELTAEGFGIFVAGVPPPLSIGNIILSSGGSVKGFLCEEIALAGSEDITSFGGWRAFLARSAKA